MLLRAPLDQCRCTSALAFGATGPGVSVTGGANGAYGTSAALVTALPHAVHRLRLAFAGFSISGGNGAAVCDILIDRAGGTTWEATPIITGLMCGFTSAVTANMSGVEYDIPLAVPQGASLGARVALAHTATITGSVGLWAYEVGRKWVPWYGTAVDTIGVSGVNGTNHVIGNLNTWSAWGNVGSPTTRQYGALAVGMGLAQGDTSVTAMGRFMEVGISGVPIAPLIYMANTTGEQIMIDGVTTIEAEIPEGAQLQVRGIQSVTHASEGLTVGFYGIY